MVHWQSWIFLWYLCLFTEKFAGAEASISHYPIGGHIYRYWSEWTSWSSCSRSCGGGVSARTRICRMRWMYHSAPMTRTCPGETTDYKMCESHECPLLTEDFLSYQCKLHNGHVVGGVRVHDWQPRRDVDNPCELQCHGKGVQLVYSFGKVIDGTLCNSSSSPAICVNGRCTAIDCAGQLGTDHRVDMCGVCGGDNSTCVRYRNSYWGHPRSAKGGTKNSDYHYDYNRIFTIPTGVTRILVKEASDTNFLVLMDQKGVILVNGNWRVGPPGTVVTAGTSFTYNRSLDGQEVLSAQGPTQTELYVLVLGRGDVPTVHYEYWFSKKPDSSFPKDTRSHKKDHQLLREVKETKIAPSKHPRTSDPKLQSRHSFGNRAVRYEGYPSYYDRNHIIPQRLQHKVRVMKLPEAGATTDSETKETTPQVHSTNTTSEPRGILSPSKEKFEAVKYRYRLKKPNLVSLSNVSFAPPVPAEGLPGSLRIQAKISRGVTTRPNDTSEFSGHARGLPSTIEDGYRISQQKQTSHGRGKIQSPNIHTASQQNDVVLKAVRKTRKKKSHEGNCSSRCPRSKQQTANFCKSDFVLRVSPLAVKRLHNETRYEVQIVKSYKNVISILPREYLWTNDTCRCPRLRPGKEYILMGSYVVVPGIWESKLFLDSKSFVKKYTRKRSSAMMKLSRHRDAICKSRT